MENLSNNEKLLTRWLNNELSGDDLQKFEASVDFKYYQDIVNETNSWELPKLDLEASYQELKSKQNRTPQKKGKLVALSFSSWQFGIAASLLLLTCFFVYTFYIKTNIVTHTTIAGETLIIQLPDGSTAHLNSKSELSFIADNWKRKRKMRLKGNAYFAVKKGNPFEVTSDQGKVVVKGTEFEISDGQGYYIVQCLEGRVEVEIFEAKELIVLDSSDVVTFIRKKGVYRSITARGKKHSWANGKTSFTKAPLSQVFEAINKQFDVEIETGNVDLELKFTGEFLHINIETALKMVCVPMRIKYSISENNIKLKSSK